MAENVGLMYGPMLIGTLLNCTLYGATAVQGFVYFQTFKSDTWWTKIFVLYLLICETLNTIFNAGVVYEPLIIRYATPRVATHAPTMISTNPLMTVLISLPVQLFIAWRIRVMSKSIVLPIIISLLALASFVGGVATMIGVILIDFEYVRFSQNYGYFVTWLASAAAADVIITVSLVRSLMHKRTGFAVTDDIINRIICLTVQTGMITALSATFDMILFLSFKGSTWNFVLDLMLSKLYTNTLLSSLNSRGGWKATTTTKDNVLFGKGAGDSSAKYPTQVEITTTVITDFHPQDMSHSVPLKVLDSDLGCGHDSDSCSAVKAIPAYVDET